MRLRLPSFLIFLVAIQGCSPSADLIGTNAIDPAGRLNREDYLALRDRQTPEPRDAGKKTAPPIPKMPDDWQTVPPKNSPLLKLVSVDVTDSVPVRDVLLELVRRTGANLELDPRVRGNVIIAAHDQPFIEVLKRICSLANLRYYIDGAFLHIGPDEPYQKTYHLDYLSLSRHASSKTSISTNVFDVDVGTSTSGSNNASNGSSSAENNSTAKVTGTSNADFWAEAEKSIAQIIASNERGKSNGKTNYSIDKQAGILTVYGDQKQQNAVAKYLTALRRKSSTQVLIDARIIEVELNESYQSGIDWAGAVKNSVGLAANFGTQVDVNTNGYFTAGVSGTNFSGLINLIQQFGTTRVLSAPRITVLNNQTAVMKVATNQVYFVTQAQFTTTTNASGASITTNPVYTSTPHTVPVGLVMTVQPAIDAATNTVKMTLRPTISRVVGQVDDPSIGLNAANAGLSTTVESQIPILAVREMDSVVQLRSGEIAIMGGLMQDSSINTDKGIPGLADVAVLGNLFKSRDNQATTSELVILLRATIAEQPMPDTADGDLYTLCNHDPRPLPVPHSANENDVDENESDQP